MGRKAHCIKKAFAPRDPAAPPTLIEQLFAAQNGLCFHCGGRMYADGSRHTGVNREHVFSRKNHIGKGMAHNIVLTHPICNHTRGNRPPTEDEIERATLIYASMGLVAFIPADAPLKAHRLP